MLFSQLFSIFSKTFFFQPKLLGESLRLHSLSQVRGRPTWDPDGKPVNYLGGVVYTDRKNNVWRVYKSKGERYDDKVKIRADDMEGQWAKCLQKIEDRHATGA